LFFGNEGVFTHIPLERLQEINAFDHLTHLKDELISPEQSPVIERVLRFESVKSKSLVRSTLDYAAKEKLFGFDKRRWEFTSITPEMEAELAAKLMQKHHFDRLIERPTNSLVGNNPLATNNTARVDIVFQLRWKKNDVQHKVWIESGLFAPYFSYVSLNAKTQNFEEKLWGLGDRSETIMKSPGEIGEILAYAYLKSEYDPQKENTELGKAKEEGKRWDAVVIPVPAGPSLEMQLILQQMAARQVSAKLEEIERRLR